MGGHFCAPMEAVGLNTSVEDDSFDDWLSDWVVTIMCLAVLLYTVHWVWTDYQVKLAIEARQKAWKELTARMTIAHRDDWTLTEIAQYDGQEDQPILFAVRGKVYNVWRGRNFYGKGECYECFAGKDATRMLGKELLAPEEPAEEGTALTPMELMTLSEWMATFDYKYDDVGWLKDSESHIAKALKGSAGESIPLTEPDSATADTPAPEEGQAPTKPTMSRVQQVMLERQQLHS